MKSSVETRLDRNTLIVRIPMRVQRRGGRKRILAPDGSAMVPASKPQPDGTLVKALARARRWQTLLDAGVYTSLTELAGAERLNQSYVSRILRLTLLAPDVVEHILDGRQRNKLDLAQLAKPFPLEWEKQRQQFLESGSPCSPFRASTIVDG